MSSGPSPAIRILIIAGVMVALGAAVFAFGLATKPSTTTVDSIFDDPAFGESAVGEPAYGEPSYDESAGSGETAADGWIVFRLPDATVRVELPGAPSTTDMLATPALSSLKDSMVFARQHMATTQGLAVSVGHVRYVQGITVNLDGAADGAIGEIRANPVVRDVSSTKERGTVGGFDGLFVSAQIKAKFGPDFLAEMFLFEAGGDLVHMSVTFPSTDANGPVVWRRVLNTLKNTSGL